MRRALLIGAFGWSLAAFACVEGVRVAYAQSAVADPLPAIERLKHGLGHAAVASSITLAGESFGLSTRDATLLGTVAFPVAFETFAEWARFGTPIWRNPDGWGDIVEHQLPWALYLVREKKWKAAALVGGAVLGFTTWRALR